MNNRLKLLIIGLDGATFSILNPLINSGLLPNLAAVFAQSATASLRSTIPPVTALAWPTFMTGTNPGRHGLMGWQEPLNEKFERPLANARKMQGAKLWHYLNAAGFRTAVVNVPVTYPPEPIDGIMICGMLTPNINSNFTYPREFKESLLDTFPNYKTDIDVRQSHRHRYNHEEILQFLQEAQKITQIRGKSFQWLLEKENPDAAIVVFELPDRLQHLYWRQIACLPDVENNTAKAGEIRDALIACYQVMDIEIGRLTQQLEESTRLLFLSDHGFGPITTNVHLNDWLVQQGWANYGKLRAKGWNILRQIGKRYKKWLPATMISKTKKTIPLYKTLDWTKTIAYSGSPSENGIFINLKDREPAGIVTQEEYETIRDQIVEALRMWRHPLDSRLIMKSVSRREEVYHGPYTHLAPDVVFELERGFYISDLTTSIPGQLFSDVSEESWGFHEREGIFSLKGLGVTPGYYEEQVDIMDILPTILYALKLAIPNNLDGKVQKSIFDPNWLVTNPVELVPATSFNLNIVNVKIKDDELKKTEHESLAERMRSLGYMSD